MGQALAEAHPAAMATWEQAEDALNLPVRDIAWYGDAEALARTDVTQPCLLTAEVAALQVIREFGLKPVAAAGHSLGEYAALVAAGALSFSDAVRIVRVRGQAMQDAAERSGGGMAAVIGADEGELEALCAEIGGIALANINAPGQVVVSGTDAGLAALEARGKEIKARRVLRLNVAGPFHSPAMQPAAESVASALVSVTIHDPRIPVYANVTALPEATAAEVRANLGAQVTGRVRWVDSIRNMASAGVLYYLELGPGTVLAGLIKRIRPDATVFSVGDPTSLESFKVEAGL
jgi:[acyl-carrier-protein] S-malonyltransferase